MGSVQFQIVPCSNLTLLDTYRPLLVQSVLTTGILICCSGHFQSGSLCLFSFCLQVSTVSNFHPDTSERRWCLVQVRLFSYAVGREGHCRQISLACVGRTRSVPATLGLPPAHGVCAFPVHTAQAPGCPIWSRP